MFVSWIMCIACSLFLQGPFLDLHCQQTAAVSFLRHKTFILKWNKEHQ